MIYVPLLYLSKESRDPYNKAIHSEIKNIYFVIAPQVHMLDITGPAQIFYEANEYGENLTLHFLSMSDATETSSSAGLYFSRLTPFNQCKPLAGDLIFVPGLDYRLLQDKAFLKEIGDFLGWLRQQHARGVEICSICTGAFLLAESGLLNGKSCTTHWKYLDDFAKRFPQIKLEKNRLFVENEGLYTSAGMSSGIDLSLYILEKSFGSSLVIDLAKEVVIYFRRSESDPQLSIFLQYRNHLENRIHDVQDYLGKELANAPQLQELAEIAHTSSRNLTRLFKKTTGITLGAYIEKLRVERAVKLLSEGNKVAYVAKNCGLKSENQLRSLLKKHKGLLPTEL